MAELLVNANLQKLESGEILSELERNIFDVVTKTCNLFDHPVVARISGGWVRDKLLGGESDDIDFALEGSSGEEFAMKMKEIQNIKVQLNPAQSQQLESAKICLFSSFWVDACQLRCDEYTEESRIPKIRVGSPFEDAARRDITINCLYFNINTRKVEDFCDGLTDLINGFVRTPIDPFLSFSDDPLRILRTFRFASRFNFKIDPIIIEAAKLRLKELQTKVTHPRIETELQRALSGPDPSTYIKYLIETNLFAFIFDQLNIWQINENRVIERLMISCPRFQTESFQKCSYPLTLATIFYDLQDHPPVADPAKPSKKIPALECAMVRMVKSPTNVYNCARLSLAGAKSMIRLRDNVNRVSVGLWLIEIGEFWPLCRTFCYEEEQLAFFDNVITPFVESEKLDGIWNIKPLVDGKNLAQIHKVKPGPIITKLTKQLIEWQLANPEASADDYKSYVINM